MARPSKNKASTISLLREKLIDISLLKIDPKNNRWYHLQNVENDKFEKIFWKDSDNKLLLEDIKQRGLTDPLILYPNSNVVAEGNSRLKCLLKLHQTAKKSSDSQLKKFKKLKVRCQRISPGTPQVDIEVYLTQIHVAGKKQWPIFNQSRLLHDLYYADKMSYEEVARILRSTKLTVIKKIKAYKYLKEYHEKFNKDIKWIEKFYHFWEFQNNSLTKFRANANNVRRFMSWVFENKFPTSKDVRILPLIINDKKAFELFTENNLDDALKRIYNIDPSIKSPLFKRVQKMQQDFATISRDELIKIVNEPPRIELLEELEITLRDLLKDVKALKAKEG